MGTHWKVHTTILQEEFTALSKQMSQRTSICEQNVDINFCFGKPTCLLPRLHVQLLVLPLRLPPLLLPLLRLCCMQRLLFAAAAAARLLLMQQLLEQPLLLLLLPLFRELTCLLPQFHVQLLSMLVAASLAASAAIATAAAVLYATTVVLLLRCCYASCNSCWNSCCCCCCSPRVTRMPPCKLMQLPLTNQNQPTAAAAAADVSSRAQLISKS
jgi:hypothetical protein